MHAGIDFGTSSCLIGTSKLGQIFIGSLSGDRHEMPSAIYVLKQVLGAESVDDPKHQETLRARVATYKQEQTREIKKAKEKYERAALMNSANPNNNKISALSWKTYMTTNIFSDAELISQARTTLQRELVRDAGLRQSNQNILEAMRGGGETTYGHAAILQSLEQGDDGFFIKSPKSFLGSKLHRGHLEIFNNICYRMFSHIKRSYDKQIKNDVSDVVIGRPVNFHGTGGEHGNRQALNILTDAAKKAGYRNIEFMLEPVAAAIDFERTLTQNKLVLVIDIGGGTTDCTILHLGPSYRDQKDRMVGILAHTGDRTGGLDLDIQLIWHSLMPLFGRGTNTRPNGISVPNHIFWGASAINDFAEQASFFKTDITQYLSRAEAPDLLKRLFTLQQKKSTPQLHMVAEAAKIALSSADRVSCELRFIEHELVAEIFRKEYEEAVERPLSKFIKLAKDAVRQAGVKPDLVYVTGGTAQSPIIRKAIQEALEGEAEIISGNLFEGVISGLSLQAEKIYR